jgi:hypothetical protein
VVQRVVVTLKKTELKGRTGTWDGRAINSLSLEFRTFTPGTLARKVREVLDFAAETTATRR